MLIEELNRKRIPESHNKIKKSGTTFGYNLINTDFLSCLKPPITKQNFLPQNIQRHKDFFIIIRSAGVYPPPTDCQGQAPTLRKKVAFKKILR